MNAFEAEAALQLIERHLLTIVLWRPPEQAQEVNIAEREKTVIPVGCDAHYRSMFALRKLRSIGRDQQRKMGEARSKVTDGLKDEQMFKGIRQVILAANDVADFQIDVVGA